MSEKKVYRTPGRECSHAARGCCPRCFDPAGILKSTREFRLKLRLRQNSTSNEPQMENQKDG